MSENPDRLRPELADVLKAINDVTSHEKCYTLFLRLGLSRQILDNILSNTDRQMHKIAMIGKWLDQDPDASWEKLASVLVEIEHSASAQCIRQQFMSISEAATESGIKEDERCMFKISLDVISLVRDHKVYAVSI